MIELKPFKKEDFLTLINWVKNEKNLMQFAGSIFTFPLSKNQLDKYLNDLNRKAYKVVDKTSGFTIGHSEIYLNKNTAKLCRILIGNLQYRGKGIGEKIVKELVQISFEEHHVKKIELNVYDWNIAAIKCYEKVGFSYDKGKTKTTKFKNELWTAVNMRIEK